MKTTDMLRPFSNGTEAEMWYSENCSRCTRAYHPKNGEYPKDSTMKQYISIGKECKMKYDVDMGFILGEIPFESVARIGYERISESSDGKRKFCTLKSCMMFSDSDDDRYKPSKRPKPDKTPPNQTILFSEFDEILNLQVERV